MSNIIYARTASTKRLRNALIVLLALLSLIVGCNLKGNGRNSSFPQHVGP